MNSKNEKEMDFSAFSQADEYFEKNVLPREINGYIRSVNRQTPYTQVRNNMIILIKEGTGILSVNGLDYRLEPGILATLGPFHRYRYSPDKGQTLKIAECSVNTGAYVYLIANPYYKIQNFEVPSEILIVKPKGIMKEIAVESVDGIIEETGSNESCAGSLMLCYITDLFGVIRDGRSAGNAVPHIEY